jgi:hypothetical protein
MRVWNKILDILAVALFTIIVLGFSAMAVYVVAIVNVFIPFNWYDWVAVGLVAAFIIWRYIRWDSSSYETELE